MCVCAWLVNFQSVLIPPKGSSDDSEELEVDKYLDSFYDTESEYDADTELSDDETLSYQATS